VHPETEQDCDLDPEFDEGVYTCNGKRAIMTWLQVDKVPLLYPRCTPPRDAG
jgi:hypothetical protein